MVAEEYDDDVPAEDEDDEDSSYDEEEPEGDEFATESLGGEFAPDPEDEFPADQAITAAVEAKAPKPPLTRTQARSLRRQEAAAIRSGMPPAHVPREAEFICLDANCAPRLISQHHPLKDGEQDGEYHFVSDFWDRVPPQEVLCPDPGCNSKFVIRA